MAVVETAATSTMDTSSSSCPTLLCPPTINLVSSSTSEKEIESTSASATTRTPTFTLTISKQQQQQQQKTTTKVVKTSSSSATTNKKIMIHNNNRLHHREQLMKQLQQQRQQQTSTTTTAAAAAAAAASAGGKKRNRGATARIATTEFEYAIEKDGTVLAERKWHDRHVQKTKCSFQQQQQQQSHSSLAGGVIWSMTKLQQEIRSSKRRHEQKQMLPTLTISKETSAQRPTAVVSSSCYNNSSVSSSSSFHNNKKNNSHMVPPTISSSVFHPPPPTAAATAITANSNSNNPYSTTNSNKRQLGATSGASFTTTTSIIPTPNTCTSNPYNNSCSSTFLSKQTVATSLFGPRTTTTTTTAVTTTSNSLEFDDDFDDVLANIDETALLTTATSAVPPQPQPSYSSCSSNIHNNNNYCNNNQHNKSCNNYNNNSSSSSSFTNTSSSLLPSDGPPVCPGHGLPCQVLTSQSVSNPGRQFFKCAMPERHEQCDFFQWCDDDSNMSIGGGNDGTCQKYNNNNYTCRGNSSTTAYSSSDNNNSSFHYDDSNNAAAAGAPLCPGHNLPCRILTSHSAKNPNRQFYKCPMPDKNEQCDFFEWADGDDNNNTSNNYSSSNNFEFDNETTTTLTTSWMQQQQRPLPPPAQPLPGCKDIHEQNRRIFGHKSFRPGQQEIIEQAVSGRDVFVLMPTGGGKSLCYQLPAWCCPGISIVISPLLSLIQDQVQSMTKLGVKSVFLNSSQDYETEQRDITRELFATTATTSSGGGIKLLYITPEKLRHSNMIQQLLTRLYQNNSLNRFVVDEAHCLSDWGHDFRPDYQALNFLRESFPNVPLMALTATANQKVVDDAISALRMKKDCYQFRSSFNRPNLHYEVRKKDGKAEDSICDYIVSQHNNNNRASGVIYCLSRKDCEKLSEKLQEKLNKRGLFSIRVSYYHAELDPYERERRHLDWSKGTVSVLCATIAFGMGIDKPDVRFVIHYSMPKSITHYYQESGRAGRDGEKADCILYYSYKDKQVLEGMIRKSSPNPFSQSTRRKVDQLYTCLRYCENEFRCRRTMQLEFFGESFHRNKCNRTCDNCRAGREIDKRDLTEAAKAMLTLLQSIQAQRKNGLGVTLLQLTELFRGSKSKSTTKFLNLNQLKGYGASSQYQLKKKQDVDRVAHQMIFERILAETSEQNKQGFASDYVQQGEKAAEIFNNRRRFFVEFPKTTDKGKENNEETAVSGGRKRKKSPARKKTVAAAVKVSERGSVASNSVVIYDSDDNDDDEEEFDSKPLDAVLNDAIIPVDLVKGLQTRIQTVAKMWAEEETMMGNNIYYWHIISNPAIKMIAAQCPTTLDELKAIDGLGEQKISEYGQRLIKNIQTFVKEHNLADYLAKKKARNAADQEQSKKRKLDTVESSKPAAAAEKIVIEDDDFPMDPGLESAAAALVLPGEQTSVGTEQSKSKYFK